MWSCSTRGSSFNLGRGLGTWMPEVPRHKLNAALSTASRLSKSEASSFIAQIAIDFGHCEPSFTPGGHDQSVISL